jgi:hypothetical protein
MPPGRPLKLRTLPAISPLAHDVPPSDTVLSSSMTADRQPPPAPQWRLVKPGSMPPQGPAGTACPAPAVRLLS